ncbi:SchA/CurD-like domain-containing protein [Actinomadura rupiterrae]|uniref:SchA/CurD-like domain-containing protein n=1 Tax=Actinomadura rupiterrae TaxID=559627 RepID=UPI0020A381E7|nr:SchA/CurD-like domain-containing protein [Actinomadura rupiterrae]MCP2341090.1 sRNA-binding carbon storage regulator CsrA [Actinomadura rupiterrae]
MPYQAITYRVKPGHEDEIAEIFSDFRRVDDAELRDEDGTVVGRLLGTGLFIKDDVMVRVIHYEGDFVAVARKMAAQSGVHSAEAKLAPFLAQERDTSTPEAFGKYFRDSLMRPISQLSVDSLPVEPATAKG